MRPRGEGSKTKSYETGFSSPKEFVLLVKRDGARFVLVRLWQVCKEEVATRT